VGQFQPGLVSISDGEQLESDVRDTLVPLIAPTILQLFPWYHFRDLAEMDECPTFILPFELKFEADDGRKGEKVIACQTRSTGAWSTFSTIRGSCFMVLSFD
jgi:hypothetical protein